MRSLILLSLIAFGCDSTSEWCPPNTTETGDGPPRGLEVVCKKENAAGDLVAHGPKIQWYMSGKKRTESAFVDGLEDGKRREYGKAEQLTAETPYSGGLANGKRVEFFADGRKSKEIAYVKGKRHGLETAYYANGNQRTQVTYRDDKPVGEAKRWHDNGLPVGEIEWVRLELAQQASSLFNTYYVAHRTLEINREHSEIVQRFKESAEAQYAAGKSAQQDAIEAEVELAILQKDQLQIHCIFYPRKFLEPYKTLFHKLFLKYFYLLYPQEYEQIQNRITLN